MEKLKKKRGGKRSRFSLVANTLSRMLGENNNPIITSVFLKNLKKNLDDLHRLDRAIQELLAVDDETSVLRDREGSKIYQCIYEQLCDQYQRRCPKRDSKLKSDKCASETIQVRSDTTPESSLPLNLVPLFHQPAGDISESSPDSSRDPTPPSPGNVLSPVNKSWDQLVHQIEALEDSLPPELVCDPPPHPPHPPGARHKHRPTITSHLRTISLTRLLVALADDVRPERLPARDWRRVQRALAAPPLGADRVYVIKNSFLLQPSLEALRATLDAVRRNDVERCSAARAGEGAAQRLERWRRVHRDYCAGQARVSLLLLQRRWHELRLLARAWARAGGRAAGEGARLLGELCCTFPHVVQEEPPRWQELRRTGELDLDPCEDDDSEYSDEEDGNLVIDEGPTEVRVEVDMGLGPEVGAGGASSDERDDFIDKLHQIDPAQAKATLIFDSDSDVDLKDVDTSPGGERGERAGELQEKTCTEAPRPGPRVRDRLVFEEGDAGGRGAGGGDIVSGEVKSEPSAVSSEGGEGGRVGSGGAEVAVPTLVAMDSKLTMEARVPLVRVDELPGWGERARGEVPRPEEAQGRRGAQGAALTRREGSPRREYTGTCEQLLRVCRPCSVVLERLPAEGGAGGARCGRVVLPQLAQVLARRRRLLTAQVAPQVRDHCAAPAPEGGTGEHADDRSPALWHAFDLDAEKSYEPEEMLVRMRNNPVTRRARWLRSRGAELLRRQHFQLLAYLQQQPLLTGEGAAREGEVGGGPLTPFENVEDRAKEKDSRKKKIPPATRDQGPAEPTGRAKRNKKGEVKAKSAPEAKLSPKGGISEYDRWLEERNRASLMYGFKPREVKTPQSREVTEPARKKTLLNSHETVATDTTVEGGGGGKTVEGGGGGKTAEGGSGGKKRGFLRVVPLASLQGPSPGAGGRVEPHIEAVVDLCDEAGGEEQGTPAPLSSLESSLINNSRLVGQSIVSQFNVLLEPVAPHNQSRATQIPIGQILITQNPAPRTPQNPVPQSSLTQNPVPQSLPQNPVPQSSLPQNPISHSSLTQNSVPQSSLPQNRVPQSSLPKNPVSHSSLTQNPVPQNTLTQNPVPQSSLHQNPVPQSSLPQNPVPQSSLPQNPVSHSFLPQNPVPQSSLHQNPVPQSSLHQNPVLQNTLTQNRVPQSSLPQNPVPQSSLHQNPVPQSSLHQNPVPQSSLHQNPVPQSSLPQNPIPQSSLPQNRVPQSSLPQNPVPQSSLHQNPVPQSSLPQNRVPQSSLPQNPVPSNRISQDRNVIKVLIPRGVVRVPAARPPACQVPQSQTSAANSHKVQAPIPPVQMNSLLTHIAHSFKDQSAMNQTYISQGRIHVTQVPVARYLKVGPPQYRYHRPLAPSPIAPCRIASRPLPETTLSTPTPSRENSTPLGSQPPVVGTAHPAVKTPVVGSATHATQPLVVGTAPLTTQCSVVGIAHPAVKTPVVGSATHATQPPVLGTASLTTQCSLEGTAHPAVKTPVVGSATHATQLPVVGTAPLTTQCLVVGSAHPAVKTPVVGSATHATQPPVVGTAPLTTQSSVVGTTHPAAQPPWARSGKPTNAAPQPPWARSGSARVLPLTERNLLLHNRIYSKSKPG